MIATCDRGTDWKKNVETEGKTARVTERSVSSVHEKNGLLSLINHPVDITRIPDPNPPDPVQQPWPVPSRPPASPPEARLLASRYVRRGSTGWFRRERPGYRDGGVRSWNPNLWFNPLRSHVFKSYHLIGGLQPWDFAARRRPTAALLYCKRRGMSCLIGLHRNDPASEGERVQNGLDTLETHPVFE